MAAIRVNKTASSQTLTYLYGFATDSTNGRAVVRILRMYALKDTEAPTSLQSGFGSQSVAITVNPTREYLNEAMSSGRTSHANEA